MTTAEKRVEERGRCNNVKRRERATGKEEKACEIFLRNESAEKYFFYFWGLDHFESSACRDAWFGKVSKSDVLTRDDATCGGATSLN